MPGPDLLASAGDVAVVLVAAVLMDLALHHAVPGMATTAALLLIAGWQAATATRRPARVAAATAALFSIDLNLGGVAGHAAGVVLGAIAALYGVYVVTQLVVLTGGAEHVLETADLTRAEYARVGFLQLLWAVGITLVLLLGLRGSTVRSRGVAHTRLSALSLSVIILTFGLVVSSLVRLALYNDAFGLTMLRLSSMVFAGWVGIVLILVAVDFIGSGLRGWLPVAVAASALAVLASVNLWNPEAFVARHNLTSPTQVGVDYRYLDTLTTDAASVFATYAGRAPAIRALACKPDADRSIWSASWSRWNAARHRDQLGCPAGS